VSAEEMAEERFQEDLSHWVDPTHPAFNQIIQIATTYAADSVNRAIGQHTSIDVYGVDGTFLYASHVQPAEDSLNLWNVFHPHDMRYSEKWRSED